MLTSCSGSPGGGSPRAVTTIPSGDGGISAGGSLVVVAGVSKVRGGIFSTVGTTTSRTGSPTNCRDTISVETSGATSVSADGDRKSVVWGKSGSVRVDLGGRRNI